MQTVRQRIWNTLVDAGFDIQDRSPNAYFPHVTYDVTSPDLSKYYMTIPFPTGKWSIDSFELWGLSKLYTIQLRARKPDNLRGY